MKQYTFKILLFSVILVTFGCTERLDITSNERILVKGKIVDQSGEPIPNILIYTNAVNKNLATSKSDALGNFEFTSLNANDAIFSVLVNVDQRYGLEIQNETYGGKIFSSDMANRALLLNLGTIILGEITTYSLFLKNVPGDTNTLEYTLTNTSTVCYLPLLGSGNDPCTLVETSRGTLDATSENNTLDRESILGSTAFFEYKLNGEPSQIIEIPVTNPPTTYVFEY